MKAFLTLIRFSNLAFIALTMFFIKYGFLEHTDVPTVLNFSHFVLLVLATVFIAAAGYIVNDMYDVITDGINKPEKVTIGKTISRKKAGLVFLFLNLTAIATGFHLSYSTRREIIVIVFLVIIASLFLYAAYLKRLPLVGNILVSALIASVVLITAFTELPAEHRVLSSPFSLLLVYALFAFVVNLVRELVKDQEDIRGDYNAGMKTLPIILGKKRTNKLIFIIGLLPLAGLIYYLYAFLLHTTFASLYLLLCVIAPLLFFLVKIWQAESKREYHRLSSLLKIILFFGLFSIGFYQFF